MGAEFCVETSLRAIERELKFLRRNVRDLMETLDDITEELKLQDCPEEPSASDEEDEILYDDTSTEHQCNDWHPGRADEDGDA